MQEKRVFSIFIKFFSNVNSKKVQMKVKNFKPTIFLLTRRQNTPAPTYCSSLPSSPHLIKEDPKE